MVSRRRGVTAAEPAGGRPPVVAAQLGEVTPSRASPQCPVASPPSLPGGSARQRCWFSAGESAVYFGKRCPVVTVKGKRKEEDRVRPKVFGEASSKLERRAPVSPSRAGAVSARRFTSRGRAPGGRPTSGLRTGRARTACHTTGQGSQESPPGRSDRVVSVGLGHREEYDHSGSKHIKYVWFFFSSYVNCTSGQANGWPMSKSFTL